MAKETLKARLGTDGYSYPYTHEDLVFDDNGISMGQKINNCATKEYVDNQMDGLQMVKLTLEEYHALDVKDNSTFYIII